MLAFPIEELMDEQACYEFLKDVLKPEGLSCVNGHLLPKEQKAHKYSNEGVESYRCRECGNVFNAFTDTILSGISFSCREIVLMLRGFVQGDPTTQIAKELGRDYSNLLKWRHKIQKQGLTNRLALKLSDEAVEVDEVYQNSGHKGPDDDDDDQTPPPSRANKQRGRGTMESDRPPVVGIVGRESNQVRLEVCPDAKQETVIPLIEQSTDLDATIYSDEATTYQSLTEQIDREHLTVEHGEREWARDEDDDGINEVHTNTIEGLWTHWRNFIRPFRGVHQKYLAQYAVIFEWIHNLEAVSYDCLRSLLIPNFTSQPI
jgi:transposase-like protein